MSTTGSVLSMPTALSKLAGSGSIVQWSRSYWSPLKNGAPLPKSVWVVQLLPGSSPSEASDPRVEGVVAVVEDVHREVGVRRRLDARNGLYAAAAGAWWVSRLPGRHRARGRGRCHRVWRRRRRSAGRPACRCRWGPCHRCRRRRWRGRRCGRTPAAGEGHTARPRCSVVGRGLGRSRDVGHLERGAGLGPR